MLPFSAEVYHAMTAQYHAQVWPAHLIGLGLMLGALGLVARGTAAGRLPRVILALAWLWTGVVFHGLVFSGISFFAPAAALVFVIQAALLAWRGRVDYGAARGLIAWCGLTLTALAVLGAPLIGRLAGLPWTEAPLAGTSPTPTAVATIGLLLTAPRASPWLLPAPALWLGAAGWAAWALDDPASLILPVAGLGGLILWIATAGGRRPARRGRAG